MATTYNVSIVINAEDRASSAFGSLQNSLQRIGEYVIGGLLVRGIVDITNSIADMAKGMFAAAADMQTLQISFETLVAREIAMGQEVIKTRQEKGRRHRGPCEHDTSTRPRLSPRPAFDQG